MNNEASVASSGPARRGPGRLPADHVERFRSDGYFAPIPILSASDVSRTRACLDELMRRTGDLADPSARHKPHLRSKWVADLVRHPAILDAVEDVLGPNLFVWRSIFFAKPAGDPRFVAWHQDSAYWGLEPADVVTAWIALTDSSRDNGCLRVVPGSHLRPELPHGIRTSADNMLLRGQSAAVEVSDDDAHDIELAPGEMSLHHVRMLHGSRPNTSERPRVGLAIRYIATHVRQRGPRQGASLVRGDDAFGYFDHEPAPAHDDDPVALQWHRLSRRRYVGELLWETLRRPSPANLISVGRLIADPDKLRRGLRSLWRS